MIPKKTILAIGAMFIATVVIAGDTSPAQLLKSFESQAGTKGSVERGRVLFTSKHTGGKPDTPSCITCHTSNLRGRGETRAGKVIEPMAVSVNPTRFTDSAKVAKWFRRNCKTVLGRECVAREKADVIAFLMSQ